jgi:hypothetical protein
MTDLESLPQTDAGNIRKKHAVKWLNNREEISDEELKETVVPKPQGFTGSKFPTDISQIRITGTPEFIEAFASRVKPLLDFEGGINTRLEISLQQIRDNQTEELTDNYALYLSVAETA